VNFVASIILYILTHMSIVRQRLSRPVLLDTRLTGVFYRPDPTLCDTKPRSRQKIVNQNLVSPRQSRKKGLAEDLL
jgi:hypothetical protein